MSKNQRKISLGKYFIVIVLILFALPTLAFAAGFQYAEEAKSLKDLGLYRGVSQEAFVPDLGAALDRETGIVMLIRLFGLEAEAQKLTNADEVLAKFTDASSISAWAKKSVAYAVQEGLVVGFPDKTIGAKQALVGKAYCSLILRQLGYTPDYNQAPAELVAKGGLSPAEGRLFSDKSLIKDDLVGISFGALRAVDKEGKSVVSKLVEIGVLDRKTVEAVGFPPTILPPTVPALAPPPVPPSPTPSSSNSSHSDTTKPVPTITQMQDNLIIVRFNEHVDSSMNENGAQNPANYQLVDSNGNIVQGTATLCRAISNFEYEVTFASLVNGDRGEFTLYIKRIRDLSGNIMENYQQNLSIIPFSIKTIL